MEKETQLLYIFSKSTTNISSGITLENYLNHVRKNWDNADVQTASRNGSGDNDIDDIAEGRGRNTEFDGE